MNGKRVDPTRTTTLIDIPQIAPDLIERARVLSSSTLHEAAGKTGDLPRKIKPVSASHRLCGPALTVHSPGGDNLWLHRAIYAAQPGDVLVIHVNGEFGYGYWGEIMSTAAQQRGIAGLVLDGCVRDVEILQHSPFPVFARGLCMRGTGKDFGALGWINAPTLFGDMVVSAGDLIVADGDGVMAIANASIPSVLTAAEKRDAHEKRILELIWEGQSTLAIYGWE